jgi:hypothetical protein
MTRPLEQPRAAAGPGDAARRPIDGSSGQPSAADRDGWSWRAALLYLIIGVLAGTLFVSLAYFADSADSWGREGRWASGFVLTYSLALAGGFLVQAAFALLLRWLTRVTRQSGLVQWVAFGAVLGVALPWAVARVGYWLDALYFSADLQRLKAALLFTLTGSMMYAAQPAWVQASVGAATALTLGLVAGRLTRRRS